MRFGMIIVMLVLVGLVVGAVEGATLGELRQQRDEAKAKHEALVKEAEGLKAQLARVEALRAELTRLCDQARALYKERHDLEVRREHFEATIGDYREVLMGGTENQEVWVNGMPMKGVAKLQVSLHHELSKHYRRIHETKNAILRQDRAIEGRNAVLGQLVEREGFQSFCGEIDKIQVLEEKCDVAVYSSIGGAAVVFSNWYDQGLSYRFTEEARRVLAHCEEGQMVRFDVDVKLVYLCSDFGGGAVAFDPELHEQSFSKQVNLAREYMSIADDKDRLQVLNWTEVIRRRSGDSTFYATRDAGSTVHVQSPVLARYSGRFNSERTDTVMVVVVEFLKVEVVGDDAIGRY